MESFTVIFMIFSFVYSETMSVCKCDTIYHLAYGSNLHSNRLKATVPTAVYYGVAKLEGYRLDFNVFSKMWNGSTATIVEDHSAHIYGVLWKVEREDLPDLDMKAKVDEGWYFAKNVMVTMTNGTEVVARTYEETLKPIKGRPCDDIPFERRPSNTYMEAMIFGAIEHNLPSDYVGHLVSFPTNKNFAVDALRNSLGYPYGPNLNSVSFEGPGVPELYSVLNLESGESTQQVEDQGEHIEQVEHLEEHTEQLEHQEEHSEQVEHHKKHTKQVEHQQKHTRQYEYYEDTTLQPYEYGNNLGDSENSS